MPTTNTSFSSLITAIDTRAQTLASNGEAKDLVYLGKAIEAMNIPDSVSAIIDEGTTQVSNVQTEGATQVAAVQAAGANYAPLAGATFTGAVTIPDLTVTGTTTTISSTNLEVADANITVASGATTSAAADGAGITIDGASVNFQYSDSGKHMSLNTGLAVEEIKEKVSLAASTTGAIDFDVLGQGVVYWNNNQTANRTINFIGDGSNTLDSVLAVGQSVTVAALFSQGSTAYYLNAYQIDGTSVTPVWQGGSAPTGGNASSVDAYTFTIIKTASATFKVLASQTQFA
jgi:hypothetical protein